MKHTIAVALIAASISTSVLAQNAMSSNFTNTLMPLPAHLTASGGSFAWSDSVSVSVTRFHDRRLDDAVERSLEAMERKTGVPRGGILSVLATKSRSASLPLLAKGRSRIALEKLATVNRSPSSAA